MKKVVLKKNIEEVGVDKISNLIDKGNKIVAFQTIDKERIYVLTKCIDPSNKKACLYGFKNIECLHLDEGALFINATYEDTISKALISFDVYCFNSIHEMYHFFNRDVADTELLISFVNFLHEKGVSTYPKEKLDSFVNDFINKTN